MFIASNRSPDAIDDDVGAASSRGGRYRVFCDLDGVLVDFDAGVRRIFGGRSPSELPNQGVMWGGITKADSFYANLPWTRDGRELWEELRASVPRLDVLTGVPRHSSSRAEKFAWCETHLTTKGEDGDGARTAATVVMNHVDMAGKKSSHELVAGRRRDKEGTVNVITCWSRNKHCESKRNHVLIDDRVSLREAWEGRGGIFIHHTSTESTLVELRKRGILPSSSKPEGRN